MLQYLRHLFTLLSCISPFLPSLTCCGYLFGVCLNFGHNIAWGRSIASERNLFYCGKNRFSLFRFIDHSVGLYNSALRSTAFFNF